MKIAAILYTHRHGSDVIFVRPDGVQRLPKITNELLRNLGCGNPELGIREDESAEWVGPYEAWKLPSVRLNMPKGDGDGRT